jgi:hypothetical protein
MLVVFCIDCPGVIIKHLMLSHEEEQSEETAVLRRVVKSSQQEEGPTKVFQAVGTNQRHLCTPHVDC